MGRRKLEIKRIEDSCAMQVTFSKRRNGLLKKAKELSVLCDVDVGVFIFSNRGKLYHYCNPNNLSDIVKRYNRSRRAQLIQPIRTFGTARDQFCPNYGGFDLLKIADEELGKSYIDQLGVNVLVDLETQLEDAIHRTRTTKFRCF